MQKQANADRREVWLITAGVETNRSARNSGSGVRPELHPVVDALRPLFAWLLPNRSDTCCKIDVGVRCAERFARGSARRRPSLMIERRARCIGEKAASRCVHVAVSKTALLMDVKALREHDRQMIASTRHCHIKQSALLLDFFLTAACHIGRNAPVDAVQYLHYSPFLAFRGMNGR